MVLVLQYILNDSEQKSTARVGKPYSLHPTANPATSPITLINATACRRIAGAWCVVRGAGCVGAVDRCGAVLLDAGPWAFAKVEARPT